MEISGAVRNKKLAQVKIAEWETQIFVSKLARLQCYRCRNEIIPLGARVQKCQLWAGKVESKHLNLDGRASLRVKY